MTTAPVKQVLRCEQHGAVAGWQCTVCHHALCPDCAATRPIHPVSMTVCARCGEMAEQLVQKKGEGASLAQRIPGAFAFPFKGEGLPAWLGISLWMWATSWLGTLGFLIGWGGAMGSFFGLTRSTARGAEGLELSDFQDFISSVLLPVVRFTVAMAPAWVGALAAQYFQLPWLTWASLGLTVVWSPTAFIGAATNANLADMLNPFRVLRASAMLGRDFSVYVGALAAVSVVMLISFPLALIVNRVVLVPVAGGVMTQMILIYGPFVAARVAGLVLMLHGPVFGWGDERDSYEPLLKDVEPRGALPEKRTLPKHLPGAIELEPEVRPPPPMHPAERSDRFLALEVNPHAAPPDAATFDVALLPSHGEQSAVEIRKSIKAGRADAALDGFRATGLSASEALTFEELVWLGQIAAQHIDYESAELAFSRASVRKAPPEALGRARVMLARLLAERLNRKDDAAGWMKRIVEEHAGTPAATYADEWLKKS